MLVQQSVADMPDNLHVGRENEKCILPDSALVSILRNSTIQISILLRIINQFPLTVFLKG